MLAPRLVEASYVFTHRGNCCVDAPMASGLKCREVVAKQTRPAGALDMVYNLMSVSTSSDVGVGDGGILHFNTARGAF